MKKHFVGLAVLFGLLNSAHAQDVSLTIDAGFLEEADGVTPVPVGGLLQLIASPSGTFGAPTPSSFVSGDNVLVESFAMNYTGGTGETFNSLTSIPLAGPGFTLTAGEFLLLRFYPSLTLSGEPAAPPLATTYGQVRSNTTETFPGPPDTSQTGWFVPAAGSTADLDYITVADGGSANGPTYTDPTAYATNVVLPAIPEPSTRATLGAGLVGLLGLAAWRRRRKMLA